MPQRFNHTAPNGSDPIGNNRAEAPFAVRRNIPKKNKPNRPPLSVFDSCIYWFAMFLSIIGSVIVLFYFEVIQKIIAFSDPTVIADVESANFLFALPLLLFLDCIAIIFFSEVQQ